MTPSAKAESSSGVNKEVAMKLKQSK